MTTIADIVARNRPSIAIDLERGVVIAANAAGRELVGIGYESELPVALDVTIPALQTLRALDITGLAMGRDVALKFCSKGSHDAERCRVTMPDPALPFVVVQTMLTSSLSDSEQPEQNLSPPRSDRETLAAIARRIREGHAPSHRAMTVTHAAPLQNVSVDDETSAGEIKDANAPNAIVQSSLPSTSAVDLARLAHELKTPLTAIASAAEVMRDEQLGPMQNARYLEYASGIHDSSRHALSVIRRMLARDTTEETEATEVQGVALMDETTRACAMVASAAESRNVVIDIITDGGTPIVAADPTMLRQIILNLLNNAIKFTPTSGSVRVFTGYLDNGLPYVAIRDEGAGLNPRIVSTARQSINEPTSLSPPTQRPGGGYGLGLPLVMQLAHNIGATVEFDSAPGKGTVALVTFRGF